MIVLWNRVQFVRGTRSISQLLDKIVTHIIAVTYSNKTNAIDIDLIENVGGGYNEDEFDEREREITRKRNKSQLSSQHRRLLKEEVPYLEPKAWFHETVKYKQKMMGLYGEASGINPSLAWPTREKLADIQEYESVAFPDTLSEQMATIIQNKAMQEKVAKEREQDILKKFTKLEQWKQELNEKIIKKEASATAAKARKDRLVEEVRQHFGFKIDPRDDRFKEMLEKKEKEEKKLAKEAKRKEKEAKALTKLTKFVSEGDVVPNTASKE